LRRVTLAVGADPIGWWALELAQAAATPAVIRPDLVQRT
jgi:hypothetical protein